MRSPALLLQGLGRFSRSGRRWAVEGFPSSVMYFGNTPGDDLLCTIVLRELAKRGGGRPILMSDYPELFAGNPDVDGTIPVSDALFAIIRRKSGRARKIWYPTTHDDRLGSVAPTEHVAAHLCASAGITGQIELVPRLHLSPDELAFGRYSSRQVAIMSAGSSRVSIPNKEWLPGRFQAVVSALRDRFDFVQLGARTDPPLDGAADMRGRTTLRQAAAIIANSLTFVGLVGFLMHLSRAVARRSVIVYGGREAPWQSGYGGNINFTGRVPCAPCWYISKCVQRHECMTGIGVERVVSGVIEAAARLEEPLPIECVDVRSRCAP